MKRRMAAAILGAALTMTAASGAEVEKSTARAIMDRAAPSIVTLSFTIRVKMNFGTEMGGAEPQEMHNEINGVLLDSGIVVVSATQLSGPGGIFASMMAGQGMQMEAVPSEFLVVLPDGTELPAQLRARDSDLDLAFIQITGAIPKDAAMQPLDLTNAGPVPDVGDDILLVNRLSRDLNYEPIVLATSVSGVIRKPRTLLVIMNASDAFGSFTAAPAYDRAGKLVGLVTFRPSPDNVSALPSGRSASANMSSMMNAVRLFILPTEELVRAFEKAKG